MKKTLIVFVLLIISQQCFCWGFFGHRKINYLAVFLLPPDMIGFYKTHIDFLTEHSVDPDKRRYAIPEEGPRHYIDIDHYGSYPYSNLPHNYDSAVAKFSADTINTYGIVPWWVQTMLWRLTTAFKEKNQAKILKLSAEIGHYIADAHVPLHASHNHNGQFTNQNGIHGFWESRVPELLAEKEFDFWMDKAEHIKNPGQYIWKRVLESAAAADTVLRYEKELTQSFPADQKYSFENRNGITIRTYSTAFTTTYNNKLNGMVERRMRQSIFAVASFWYTAWVNAGQPDLKKLSNKEFTAEELKEFEEMNNNWRNGKIMGREHD
ncbi:zinc dependent phospholipase C family protein [Lacibacter sp.]|uniref:zinc dependent phospholipase C family protein n=1 Tax=Lacibacter sp. TaxID=1915409 RepID=UPI002B4B7364|nr:zinc dependent phospholipase C family protein [Lacibacter sp.]HLP39602.1 zinc dependent phospholipase C family protein [Lacibacter sp.]